MKLLEREHNSFWEGTEEASAERQQPSPEAEIRISRHLTELARPLAEEHTVALKKILSLTSLIIDQTSDTINALWSKMFKWLLTFRERM